MDFKGDKIRSTPSFGGEVKPSSHVVCLRHVKELYEHERCSSAKFSGHVSHLCFICFATRCLLALLTDASGGRIRMTRTRLIMGLITPHRTYLTITKTRKGRPRPDQGCSATDDDDYWYEHHATEDSQEPDFYLPFHIMPPNDRSLAHHFVH
jgi:hypothetical protein